MEDNRLKKIHLILQYVFEGKIIIQENYAEKLLKFLKDTDENSPGKVILDTSCFSDLIYQVLSDINNIDVSAKVFFIQLITVIFKNELQFNKVHMQGLKLSFSKLNTLFENNPPPNLYLACLKLATVQITHSSGLHLILEYKLWKNILQSNIHFKPKNISDAVYIFMTTLVSKLNEYNLESELTEVFEHVLEPIRKSDYSVIAVIDNETDTALSDKIFTYINVLLAIITDANKYALNDKVTPLLKEHFIIHLKLYEIYVATKINRLQKLINACLFRLSFGTLQHLLFNKKTEEFCIRMTVTYRNLLTIFLKKRDPFGIMDYIIETSLMWSDIEKSYATELDFPLMFEQNGNIIEFSLQIFIPLIVPFAKYTALKRTSKKLEVSDLIEKFLAKMSKTITDYIFSCCFKFGQLLDENGVICKRELTAQTLKELLRLKGHLNESQAGVIFQSLYHLLEMFIFCDENGGLVVNENQDQDDLRLLSPLLDAMKMLLKEYNISWYENVEIVTVQANLLNLLKQNFLTTKQVVKVLDLLDICVKKFLSPNMSLLVEGTSRQDNTLNEIGEVIKLYTQHEEWEVRDSAFNLLKSCTDISFIKYIPLQKVIKANNLIILAAKAGLNDPEYYSQCTALRCLAAATKIDSIWQEVLMDNQYFYLQLVYILRNHTEGMVRKEAANVLIGVYINQKLESSFQNNLFEAMTRAALHDLHWEVQLVALYFWKKVIHNHLTYRGMIDGKFPSVTFSKEKRKIVVLDKKEIQRQLAGVMNGLSAVGCLTVLLECLNEINNIDVIVQAYSIAKELIEILDKYDFQNIDNVTIRTEVLPQSEDDHAPVDLSVRSSVEDRDKVIDTILSKDQTELIIILHDNFIKTRAEEMDIDCPYYYNHRKLIQSDEFLDIFRGTDYSLLIENRKHFYVDNIGTLDALLDEILDLDSNYKI